MQPAPSMNSGAPSGSQGSSSQGQPSAPSKGAEGGAGSGGESFDYKSAFQSTNKNLQDTQKHLSSLMQDWEGKKGDLELVSKLKGVFQDPKTEAKESPVKQWERDLDFFIEQAVEAKNRGAGIPLTAKLAIDHYRSVIENYNQRQELMDQVKRLSEEVNTLRDPGFAMNQKAFASFDTCIKNGLEKIYGEDPSTYQTRLTQFQAVGKMLSNAIQEIMQKDPQRWDMIRRDPREIEKLANRALRMNLPPKAIQMIEQEHLKNTPMELGELRQAFREANNIQDSKERERVQKMIRQEILSRTMGARYG